MAGKLSGWRIEIVEAGENTPSPEAEEEGAADDAKEIADDTVSTNNVPSVGEGSEESAMDPAEKELNKEEKEESDAV